MKFKKAREESIALSLKKYDSSGRHEGDRSVYLSAILLRLSTDICEWWKSNETVLPNWGGAAKKALLVQPSSAASERVFSLLNNTFGNSLEDYVESCSIIIGNYYIYDGIFWHKNGHNQAKIVAMPKGIMGGFFGIIRYVHKVH